MNNACYLDGNGGIECTSSGNILFCHVDSKPKLRVYDNDLTEYFSKKLKLNKKYHEHHGRVFINLTIDKKGKVTNPNILYGISNDINKSCYEKVKNMPKWKPGIHKNKHVNVTLILIFHFSNGELLKVKSH
ncbi:energy transducer TonB [Aureibacter tunicatorum]|uniref:TonB C-terminal domain-containing protein n=1 Tax=Aureibacter tunicatorum TaxID=866807 RepID=A0AAE3XKA8_9BACT|nr:energy transducer TonB [Aureibacter tunicatorum]MDR6238457.1 hypothetical protein [Aureibacter tunicatorum]BDD05609.1 hypothetical protein AUTU_30920 [Aureibacter tunicatorum]